MKIILDWKTEPWQAANPRSKRMARNWLISVVRSATSPHISQSLSASGLRISESCFARTTS